MRAGKGCSGQREELLQRCCPVGTSSQVRSPCGQRMESKGTATGRGSAGQEGSVPGVLGLYSSMDGKPSED